MLSAIQTYALRLKPGEDLKPELQQIVDELKIEAACILTCVGSLQKARIRFANQPDYTEVEEKFEIVSLTGLLSVFGCHLHIALSDGNGKTIGGHIAEGNLIYTTAEIIIGIMPDYQFLREHDSQTGYKELKIQSKKADIS
jgi:hypothetical protein